MLIPSSNCDRSYHFQPTSNAFSIGGNWFRSSNHEYAEFSNMPTLRPSSKNVMSIKCDEMPHSPVAAMINDSNASSSSAGMELEVQEERLMDTTQILQEPSVNLSALQMEVPQRPPIPSPLSVREFERRRSSTSTERRKSTDLALEPNLENTPPPNADLPNQQQEEQFQPVPAIRRERSPIILTEAIATGADFRHVFKIVQLLNV